MKFIDKPSTQIISWILFCIAFCLSMSHAVKADDTLLVKGDSAVVVVWHFGVCRHPDWKHTRNGYLHYKRSNIIQKQSKKCESYQIMQDTIVVRRYVSPPPEPEPPSKEEIIRDWLKRNGRSDWEKK